MVSKAGYYAWRYGSRPILRDLRDIGEHVSRKRVVRIMRATGLSGKRRRAFRITTDSKHSQPIPGNHLDRHFAPQEPPFSARDRLVDEPQP
jgi:putative transposase